MSLVNDQQRSNAEQKLAQLEQWIAEAKARPQTPENAESLASLVQMANQLREEIIRYASRHGRGAS